MCLPVSKCPPSVRTPSYWIRARPSMAWSDLSTSAAAVFPNKVTSEVLGVRTWTHGSVLGTDSTHNRHLFWDRAGTEDSSTLTSYVTLSKTVPSLTIIYSTVAQGKWVTVPFHLTPACREGPRRQARIPQAPGQCLSSPAPPPLSPSRSFRTFHSCSNNDVSQVTNTPKLHAQGTGSLQGAPPMGKPQTPRG